MAADSFDLQRFVDAQGGGVYEGALAELKRGEKTGHWIWFVFPQHRDLGSSDTAKFYGLSGEGEAAAYFAHPVLGPRIRECTQIVRAHVAAGRTLEEIFGSAVDVTKFRSSMEIFGL